MATPFSVVFVSWRRLFLFSKMANVVKDIGEIWTRLFDHRPFLNGEIKFFLHEFEEKRDNREVDALFQVLQNLSEIRYSQIDKIKLGSEAHLQPLKNKVDESIKICNRILGKEAVYKSNNSLEKKRELRKSEWENFTQDLAKKYEKVDKAFQKKEDDLHDYYTDLEKKLCPSPKNIGRIKDPTVHFKPSEKLKKFLQDNYNLLIENTNELPDNLKSIIDNKDTLLKSSDIEWLNQFLKNQRKSEKKGLLSGKDLYDEIDRIIESKYADFDFDGFLEEKNKNETYLHELLNDCKLILPENEKIERNPILAQRIERLKKEEEEREYREMTKNVDVNKKQYPEDSISYQINMMNRQLIAVVQFLVSVGAGFAFGFLGLELMVGELGFGVRLLLGIAIALIIAIAEFYFLAKHLNEEEIEESAKEKPKPMTSSSNTQSKLHKD